ncbi:MAG: hypothetical protein U0075_22745 [Thermomicrobiales bacterium]
MGADQREGRPLAAYVIACSTITVTDAATMGGDAEQVPATLETPGGPGPGRPE